MIVGRVSAFADPDIIAMAKNDFIPCCADDWYQRRRQDDEGKFFIQVANQGPRKGEGGSTRQGIYCLTADGELLTFKNAGNSAEVTREQMKQALAKFAKLPQNRRKPGSIQIEPHGKFDANFVRIPPKEGLIVQVHARILDQKEGQYCKTTCDFPGGNMASRDFLWLTAEEVQSLIPQKPEVGNRYPMPAKIAERICRFHLIDNTRGEPDFWQKQDLCKQQFVLEIKQINSGQIDLELTGMALIASDVDIEKAKRGFDVKLLGQLRYDSQKKKMVQFDVVALGNHWGDSTYTRSGTRQGRNPLGIVFRLPVEDRPANKIPPQALRDVGPYYGRE